MRVAEWEFAEATHPVYERPPGATRWPAAPPGLVPDEYEERRGTLVEPLHMSMEGAPSVDLYQAPGGDTIQKIELRSQYTPDVDTSEVEQVAREWTDLLVRMSMGPYSLDDLREMGHPYGYGQPDDPRTSGWARLFRPRAMPSMRRHTAGVRGSMPNRSIINLQSGELLGNWYVRILRWYGGLNILFGNRSEYAWFLAHGTRSMQAHGPWETVARRLLGRLHNVGRLTSYRGWQKAMRRTQAEQAAMVGQFGEAALDRSAHDAGGFR